MILNKKTEKKTTQIGLRLDDSLLEAIDLLAQYEGIDKMDWIKRAIASEVQKANDAMREETVENYIFLRIDDDEFKDIMDYKKIPQDIIEARKKRLNKILDQEY